MKQFIFASFAFSALIAPVMAADMAVSSNGAPFPPSPVGRWTGLYIGANAGWIGSSDNTITNTGNETLGGLGTLLSLGLIPGSVDQSHSGFIGGGQISYNLQVGPGWVWGVEADFDGIRNGSNTTTSAFPGSKTIAPFTTVYNSALDSLGTVRARLGYLSSLNLLWYATGGLAYGETKIGSVFTCDTCKLPSSAQGSTAALSSSPSAGWSVGAGAEWRFAPAWSVKAEYLYVDLGNQSDTITYIFAKKHSSSLMSTADEHDNLFRVGINYKIFCGYPECLK